MPSSLRAPPHALHRWACMAMLASGCAPFWDSIHECSPEERSRLCIALIGAVEGIGTEWLSRLDAVLLRFPRESAVACAAGTVFAQCGLWGKARKLLESAATDGALPPAVRRGAWVRLATLAEREGDLVRSSEAFRQAALSE